MINLTSVHRNTQHYLKSEIDPNMKSENCANFLKGLAFFLVSITPSDGQSILFHKAQSAKIENFQAKILEFQTITQNWSRYDTFQTKIVEIFETFSKLSYVSLSAHLELSAAFEHSQENKVTT